MHALKVSQARSIAESILLWQRTHHEQSCGSLHRGAIPEDAPDPVGGGRHAALGVELRAGALTRDALPRTARRRNARRAVEGGGAGGAAAL